VRLLVRMQQAEEVLGRKRVQGEKDGRKERLFSSDAWGRGAVERGGGITSPITIETFSQGVGWGGALSLGGLPSGGKRVGRLGGKQVAPWSQARELVWATLP